MFLEICTQIHSVVFALSRQINKQKVCENQFPGGQMPVLLPPCGRPWLCRSFNVTWGVWRNCHKVLQY